MSKIIVSVSGWCEADPTKIRFQYIGRKPLPVGLYEYISGTEWLRLPEFSEYVDDICRDDYILECAGTAFATSLEGEYDQVDVEVEEEEIKN